MKQLLNTPLNLLVMIAVMSVISLSSIGQADQPRIIKVKGQQAIVQFPQGTTPIVGESLSPGGSGSSDSGSHSGAGSRDHSLRMTIADLGIYTVSNGGGSRTQFDFATGSQAGPTYEVAYGWNLQNMEFGPVATLQYFSKTGESDRNINAGGFFDFNFVPNVIGQTFIYGVGAEVTFGQQTQTLAGGTDQTTSLLDLELLGTAKWFGLSDHFAVRGDAGFDMNRSTPPSGTATTATGLLIRASLAGYF